MRGKLVASAKALLAGAVLFLAPAIARADVDFGLRAGFYEDADAGFVGAELLTGLTRQWFLNPNLEYVFVDDGDLATLNLDAHYDFPVSAPFYVWGGGGVALIYSKVDVPPRLQDRVDDTETDLGLNLIGGVGFGKGQALRPYVQGKVTISDDTEASIAFGIRFH
jgi:hypothetical protein